MASSEYPSLIQLPQEDSKDDLFRTGTGIILPLDISPSGVRVWYVIWVTAAYIDSFCDDAKPSRSHIFSPDHFFFLALCWTRTVTLVHPITE